MSKKINTMKVSGGEYAKVNARMLEFRKDNPRGLVDTSYDLLQVDGGVGSIIFKARVVKDKSDEQSAEATGHARLPDDGKQKNFEKCETIAVGRALALLGYGADGEIASAEEMEEFEEWKQQQFMEALEEATDRLNATKSEADLKKVWADLSPELKKALEGLKDERKKALCDN